MVFRFLLNSICLDVFKVVSYKFCEGSMCLSLYHRIQSPINGVHLFKKKYLKNLNLFWEIRNYFSKESSCFKYFLLNSLHFQKLYFRGTFKLDCMAKD